MEAFEDEDVRTTLLLWKTAEGAVRTDHVLRQDGDCMYLYDESGTMISAFAKTSGGAFKEYGAVNEVAEQGAWRFLSLSCALLRLGLLVLAGYHAFHTNLSSRAAAAHPGWVLGPCTGALVLDLCQREAGLYAHVHDFFGEALSLLADRLHAMVVYGTLALFYGDYCGLFLALLLLDLAACWAQLFASDCGEIEMKGLAGTLAAKAPALLVAICLASEAFLLLLYVDHGHVQFRLFQGMATGTAFLFQSPVLTIPVVKDLLLVAFLLKQLMAVSQLYCCTASLMSTTFPCVSDEAKSFLQQAIDARQRPNLEYLRNSESLHTLRGEASPFFRR